MSGRRHGHGREQGHEPFELPDTIDLDSVNAAQVAVIRLVAENRLSAREALYVSRMLEHRRRAIANATLLQKLRQLEARCDQIGGERP